MIIFCGEIGVRQLADDLPAKRDARAFELFNHSFFLKINKHVRLFIVENIGVEPMTSCLQSRRSSQLS